MKQARDLGLGFSGNSRSWRKPPQLAPFGDPQIFDKDSAFDGMVDGISRGSDEGAK
jgi:hypothetical protein